MLAKSDNSFADLQDYIALPRIDGLVLSPDGSTVVLSVSSLDPKKTAYRRSLWSTPATGDGAARRLTRSAKGEAGAAFTAAGDVLFVSGREDAESEAEETDLSQLWLLPAGGGEARAITRLACGVDAVVAVAREAATVIVSAPLLASSTSLQDDEARRKERDEKKITAILHAAFPIRTWDHDLGPAAPHLLALDLSAQPDAPEAPLAPRDLTPTPARAFDEPQVALSPDGSFAVSTCGVQEQRGTRSTLVRIDVATGERRALLDEVDVNFGRPTLSRDGTLLAYVRTPYNTPATPGDQELWLARSDGTQPRRLASAWDRWPTSIQFTVDGSQLIVTADQDGRGPIFTVDLDTDAVRQLTHDDFSYSAVAVAPDGDSLFALRASWSAPNHPVRVDLATGAVMPLPSPAPLPRVPGTVTEVTTTAQDGSPIRAWLVLPDQADAEHPAPLVLWAHGGPLSSWNAWSWRWNPMLLAEHGYAVLLPDPALSTGYGIEFIRRGWASWGDKPFTDLMAITDATLRRGDIDANRTAMMGGSFGGYMANWIAGHTDRFRAIVSHAGLWALDQFTGTTDHGYHWQREFTPDAALNNSPHRHVADIRTPMLVVHGDHDYRVPVGEALRLWAELNEHHARPDGSSPHRFLLFPDENHWVLKPQHAAIWYETVLAFLDEHVLDQPWKRPRLLG